MQTRTHSNLDKDMANRYYFEPEYTISEEKPLFAHAAR
jgi:hypothetical protein